MKTFKSQGLLKQQLIDRDDSCLDNPSLVLPSHDLLTIDAVHLQGYCTISTLGSQGVTCDTCEHYQVKFTGEKLE